MERKDYEPSMGRMIYYWSSPLLVFVVFMLMFALETNFDNWGLIICVGLSMSVLVLVLMMFSAWYPVFLSDRILICNVMIRSVMKEYRLSDIDNAYVLVSGKGTTWLCIVLKGSERKPLAYTVDASDAAAISDDLETLNISGKIPGSDSWSSKEKMSWAFAVLKGMPLWKPMICILIVEFLVIGVCMALL